MTGIKTIYREVEEATEEQVGALGNVEAKAIRVALADRHRVNRAFNLVGSTYPD